MPTAAATPAGSPRSPAPPIGLGLPRGERSRGSAVVALVVHVLILALIIRVAPTRNLDYQESAGSGDLGAGGGGGGGGPIRIVALPALAAAPVAPPPVPIPAVPPPEPVVEPVVAPVAEVVAPAPPDTVVASSSQPASGSGTGSGSGSGSGTGTGTGSGSGSGHGSGTGSGTGPGSGGGAGRARPPEPRQLILPPPDIPKALRGATIAVTFLVGPEGRVEDVRFEPEPDDRGFAKKLEDIMRSYRFRPARGPDGLPVAGSIRVELTF